MKLKHLTTSIVLLSSIIYLSCNNKVYTATDIEGDYKLYSTYYFGLMYSKTNAVYSFLKDSVYTFQACNYAEGKWFVKRDIVYIIYTVIDEDGMKNIVLLPYKITKNKLIYQKKYYLNGVKYTDTLTDNYVLIRENK